MSRFWFLPVFSFLILVLFTPRILAQSPQEDGNTPVLQSGPAGETPVPSPDAGSAAQAVPSDTPAPTPVYVSPEEARAQDLALIAAARGWTIEQAAAHERGADILTGITRQLADQRPEMYIEAALSLDAEGPPSIYIKGPADDFVRGLVANAEIKINIVDNQPFSLQELDERKMQVVDALRAMGFSSFSASFRFEGAGQIEATVTRQPGLPDDPDEILSGFPEELRDSVTLTVSDEPVSVPLRGSN